MDKELMILKMMFPERESFDDGEIGYVSDVLRCAAGLPKARLHLPRTGCGIGEEIEIAGHRYRCVPVPADTHWTDCCRGCDFARRYRNCDDVLCSKFDRRDGRFVWYVEVE